ncbi:DsrE/DsrF/DrsH-like family protein [Pedomonas sp. V897]|uniref:DsrE/DsrF/DrsH-like family protein n=1 Tax=Pedomonas sp. V897 TaxID=3446482 RepID=UPI003EE2213A
MAKTHRGLAIIFSDSTHGRIHAGLNLACASAAMGRPVQIFFHGEAVTALDPHRKWKGDDTFASAGLPSICDMVKTALELGIPMTACTTGLHLCGLTANQLPGGVEAAGMVAFLADAKDCEIVFV